MELICSLIIILTLTKHRRGFSHVEFSGCRSVYFYSDHEDMEIYIDGEPTGVKAPGMLYFPENKQRFFVEYKMRGLSFFSQEVVLENEKTLVLGRITPVINLLA